MVPSNTIVRAINGTVMNPLGHIILDVLIAKQVLQVRFYVMPAGTMEEHVVLGRTWCFLTNCQIDWHKQQVKMVYKGITAQVPLLQGETSKSPSKPTKDSTVEKGKGKLVLS